MKVKRTVGHKQTSQAVTFGSSPEAKRVGDQTTFGTNKSLYEGVFAEAEAERASLRAGVDPLAPIGTNGLPIKTGRERPNFKPVSHQNDGTSPPVATDA
jgi:hypothetical protein